METQWPLWHGGLGDQRVIGSVGEGLFVTLSVRIVRLWTSAEPPVELDSYTIPVSQEVQSWGSNENGTIAVRTGDTGVDALYVFTTVDGFTLNVDSVLTPLNDPWPADQQWFYDRTLVSGDGLQILVGDRYGGRRANVFDVGNLSSSRHITMAAGNDLFNYGYIAAFPRAGRILWVNTSPAVYTHRLGMYGISGENQTYVPTYPNWSVEYTFNFVSGGWQDKSLPVFDPAKTISKKLKVQGYFQTYHGFPPAIAGDAMEDRGNGYILNSDLSGSWAYMPGSTAYGEVYGEEPLDFALSGDYTVVVRANQFPWWQMNADVVTEIDNVDAGGGNLELRDFTDTVIASTPYVEECFNVDTFGSGDGWPKPEYTAWIPTSDGGAVYTRGRGDDMDHVRYRKLSTAGDVLEWASEERTLVTGWENIPDPYRYDYGIYWVPITLSGWNDGSLALALAWTDGGD
jgi:hypothetical protein